MNNYKLYVHIAPNGKRYYGITKQDPKRRWRSGHGYKNNQHFTNAINKYGWDNIEHIILFDSLTEYEAKELEQYYIQWYQTADRKYGYNISLGGESSNGLIMSEETKQKISENHVNISGKNNPMYGKHHSKESKQKMSKAKLGKYSGEKSFMYGKHRSEETKQKISEGRIGKYSGKNNPRAKSVICITTGKIFFTAKEGAEYYNANSTHIGNCCKGKTKSCGNFNGQKLVWRYVNYKHKKFFRVA